MRLPSKKGDEVPLIPLFDVTSAFKGEVGGQRDTHNVTTFKRTAKESTGCAGCANPARLSFDWHSSFLDVRTTTHFAGVRESHPVAVEFVSITVIARHGANVFHQHEKVPAVGRRRHKAKMPIEPRRRIIFCMNGKRANSDNIGNLQGASQGIQRQAGPDAAPLPCAVHGKPRQHELRYGVTRHAFDNANGCVNMTNLTRYNRVEPNDRLVT